MTVYRTMLNQRRASSIRFRVLETVRRELAGALGGATLSDSMSLLVFGRNTDEGYMPTQVLLADGDPESLSHEVLEYRLRHRERSTPAETVRAVAGTVDVDPADQLLAVGTVLGAITLQASYITDAGRVDNRLMVMVVFPDQSHAIFWGFPDNGGLIVDFAGSSHPVEGLPTAQISMMSPESEREAIEKLASKSGVNPKEDDRELTMELFRLETILSADPKLLEML